MNKVTGEIVVLDGTALIRVADPEDAVKAANVAKELSKLKEWPVMPLGPLDTSVSLNTSCRDEKLYYRFTVAPFRQLRDAIAKKSSGDFTVVLLDGDGFKLVRIPIAFDRLEPIVNDAGVTQFYEANDSVSCSPQLYRQVKTWTVEWHF